MPLLLEILSNVCIAIKCVRQGVYCNWVYCKDFQLPKLYQTWECVFKVGLSTSKKVVFYLLQWKLFRNDGNFVILKLKKKNICFNEGALQMIKNVFYFIQKFIFLLKIFKFWSWLCEFFPFSRISNFCLDYFIMKKKRLD